MEISPDKTMFYILKVWICSCLQSIEKLQIIQRTFDISFGLIGKAGINHSRFNVFVPEKFLNKTDIRSLFY